MADELPKVVSQPATAYMQDSHPRAVSSSPRNINDLEATELVRLRNNYSRATASYRAASVRAASAEPPRGIGWWRHAISKFWSRNITMVVDHDLSRDFLSVERTYLAHVRTSLVLSILGVSLAQLFRLTPTQNSAFGFYILGKPLACICQTGAMYSLLLGAYRVWKHQHALARGKAIAGGFDLFLLGIGVLVLCILFFVLIVAIDANNDP